MEFIDFALRNRVLFSLALVLIGLLIGTEVYQRLLGVKSLGPAEATRLINHQDAVPLDVRDTADYRNGHLPQAQHVPMGELKNRLKELNRYRGKPLLVYCRTGNQSAAAGRVLQKQGFEQVYSLRGGLTAWQDANLPLSKKK